MSWAKQSCDIHTATFLHTCFLSSLSLIAKMRYWYRDFSTHISFIIVSRTVGAVWYAWMQRPMRVCNSTTHKLHSVHE